MGIGTSRGCCGEYCQKRASDERDVDVMCAGMDSLTKVVGELRLEIESLRRVNGELLESNQSLSARSRRLSNELQEHKLIREWDAIAAVENHYKNLERCKGTETDGGANMAKRSRRRSRSSSRSSSMDTAAAAAADLASSSAEVFSRRGSPTYHQLTPRMTSPDATVPASRHQLTPRTSGDNNLASFADAGPLG